MGVTTQDLKFNVLAQVVGQQAVDKLANSMQQVEKNTGFLTKGVKLLAGAFAVSKIVEFGHGVIQNAAALYQLSQKTGATVTELAKLKGVSEALHVDFGTVTIGLKKLAVNMVDAAGGGADMSATFKALKINVRDANGQIRPTGDVMKDLADRFEKMKDGPVKAALAVKLFGRAGVDLIPVLNEGSSGINAFSTAMDQDFGARAERFEVSLSKIGKNMKATGVAGVKQLLPTLQELATAFDDLTSGKEDFTDFFDVIGEAARHVVETVVILYTTFKELSLATLYGYKEIASLFKSGGPNAVTLDNELQKKLKELHEREDRILKGLNKNSLLFGKGTAEEIKERQKKDTAPKHTRGAGAGPDPDELGGGHANVLRAFDEKIAKIQAEAGAIGQSNAQKQAAVLLAELESKGITTSSKAYATYSARIIEATAALETAKEKQSTADYTRKQTEAVDLQRLQLENYSLSTAELTNLVQAKELDNQATEATIHFTEEGKRAYEEATEAIKLQKAEIIALTEAQKHSFGHGARESFKEYLEMARNVSQQTKEMFTRAFGNIEDSMVSFVKTGKLNFEKFTEAVLDDLLRILIRAAAVQAITGVAAYVGSFGGSEAATTAGEAAPDVAYAANGGIMSAKGMIPLNKYSRGGIANSAQLAVFGEGSRPEAFVPLPDGRSIPVSMKGGGGGDTNVNVSVIMGGADSTKADTDKGAALGKLIANAVKVEILNQQRPGGVLA